MNEWEEGVRGESGYRLLEKGREEGRESAKKVGFVFWRKRTPHASHPPSIYSRRFRIFLNNFF